MKKMGWDALHGPDVRRPGEGRRRPPLPNRGRDVDHGKERCTFPADQPPRQAALSAKSDTHHAKQVRCSWLKQECRVFAFDL